MARLRREVFTTMRSEGGLLPVDFLRQVGEGSHDVPALTPGAPRNHEAGSLTLTLRVGDTFEVRRWILGWGAAAEVLEPARLRREIAAEARKIAERDA